MATATMSSSPITQVSQVPTHTNLQPQLLTRLLLDLRGKRFSVDRETIMNLPESVLLCLFPNGLVLSRQSMALSDGGDEEDEELYGVDVSCRGRVVMSSVLITINTVRPRMLLICAVIFPGRVRHILWNTSITRPLCCSTAPDRQLASVRLRFSLSKSAPHKASNHSAQRRT